MGLRVDGLGLRHRVCFSRGERKWYGKVRSEAEIRFCIPRKVFVSNWGPSRGSEWQWAGRGKKEITRLRLEKDSGCFEGEQAGEGQKGSVISLCWHLEVLCYPFPRVSQSGTGRWLQLIGCSFHLQQTIISLQGVSTGVGGKGGMGSSPR